MLRSSLGRLALAAVLASSVLGTAAAAPASASTGPALIGSTSKCQDVVFIGAEGSGQTYADNQGLGPEVRGALDGYASHLDGYSIGFFPVPYPSAPADAWSLALTDYSSTFFQSIDSGVKETLAFLAARSQCKDEHYVLAGYSQGAMVMHRTLAQLTSPTKQDAALAASVLPRIDGVLALADGDRIENQGGGSYGTAAPGYGITWPFNGVSSARYKPMSGPIPSSDTWPASRFLSVCDAGDIVCDFGHAVPLPTPFKPALWQAIQASGQVSKGLGIHEADYRPTGSGGVFVASAAASIARTTRELQPRTAPTFNLISAGDLSSCSVLSGSAYCWGYNGYGQLGNNSTDNSPLPVQVLGVGGQGYLSGVSSVATTWGNSCAIANGSAYCWGDNYFGQLGNGTTASSMTPVQVAGPGGIGHLDQVTALTLTYDHACAISSGKTYCWGRNSAGQLGDGTTNYSNTPVQVAGVGGSGYLTGVTAVYAGYLNTCAIASGNVYCWGDNGRSQLGNGSSSGYSASPVQVLGVGGQGVLSGVTAIAGGEHFCALSSGSVYCWGGNFYGQLGDGTTTDRSTPVQVLGAGGQGDLTGATAITSNGFMNCALAAGNVYCWGDNWYGQLGNGTNNISHTPVEVVGVGGAGNLGGIAEVSTGGYHTCGRDASGAEYCWGFNAQGQLGDGTTANSTVPVTVAFP